MAYSRFMYGLGNMNINLNRKVLSELAMTEPFSFKALVDQVRFMRGIPASAQAQAELEKPAAAKGSGAL